jgi:hypothetical protein
VRQAVFRLRQRFRALLRQTVADTLAAPTEALIDEELAALRAALATQDSSVAVTAAGADRPQR